MNKKSDSLHVTIRTPQGFSTELNAKSIQVKTTKGPVTILKNHAPMIALLEPGKLKVIPENSEKTPPKLLYIEQSGLIEVERNTVTILADNGFYGQELDQEALKASATELRNKLASNNTSTLNATLKMLNEVNEKLRIVEEIRNEQTQ